MATPIDMIRETIAKADDQGVVNFLTAHALGTTAALLIKTLDEHARGEFFEQLKKMYPQYWEKS